MTRRNCIILVLILLLIGGVIYGLRTIKQEPQASNIFPNDQEKIVPLAQETIDYISAHLNELSLIKPVLGGSWHINRFSLIDESYLYIEYEDGHIMGRLLLEKQNNQWKMLASFKPGKDMWELASGKDSYSGAHVTIYEMDQNTRKWIVVR